MYGALYLCFVAYPIAFQTQRGWLPGLGGLAFVGIGVGVLLTIASEPLFRKVINLHQKDPETGEVIPEAMAIVVSFGAILLAVGQLWFAWTCQPSVHWIFPILAGAPFGIGNSCVFIYANKLYGSLVRDLYCICVVRKHVLPKSHGCLSPARDQSLFASSPESQCNPAFIIHEWIAGNGRRVGDRFGRFESFFNSQNESLSGH